MATGALILAKSADSASWISKAFKDSANDEDIPPYRRFTVKKTYLAIVDDRNMTRPKGKIKAQFREGTALLASETHFKRLASYEGLSIVELKPKTGF